MNSPSLSAGQNRGQPFHGSGAAAKGREKFLSAKIRRNPLKRLDSDEGIQGNPSLSNPIDQVFAAKRPEPKKTQTGSTGLNVALLLRRRATPTPSKGKAV
jgi:hypothetical protein